MRFFILLLLLMIPQPALALSNNEIINNQTDIDFDNIETKDSIERKKCLSLLKLVQQPLIEFMKVSGIKDKSEFDLRNQLVLKLKKHHCNDMAWRKKAVRGLLAWLKSGSKKIAVFLPLTGPSAPLARATLNGMKASMGKDLVSFDRSVMVFDTQSSATGFKKAYASAMLLHRPDLVVGGLTPEDASFLVKLADAMRMPTMLLRNSREAQVDSPFVFKVFPNDRGLAVALVQSLRARGAKRVAILAPERRHQGLFVASFRDQLEVLGIGVSKDISYREGNFDFLDMSLRELLNINPETRKDELAELVEVKKKEAEDKNMPFDEKNVNLPPQVDFDALFIPDHFRNVKHIIRLLKYHGVSKKILLVGDQQWRSPSLFSPFDPFLEGALFADYIGFYDELPKSIGGLMVTSADEKSQTPAKEFIPPEMAQDTDFKLIGYRAGTLARMALTEDFTTRRALAKELATHTFAAGEFFVEGPGFDKNRLSYWPAFVFQVERQKIILNARFGPVSKSN